MKLTRENMTWSHLKEARKRFRDVDGSGKSVAVGYDKLFIGLRPAGRAWLESRYTGDEPVCVFILGLNNVIFTHKPGDATMYVNNAAGAQALEYAYFYADKTGASVEMVDDLPTNHELRKREKQPDSLEGLIALACGRDIAGLGI